jgi:hypothetical protein
MRSSLRSSPRSTRWAAAAVWLAVVLAPSVALADAAGPTDYRTTVVSVTPPIEGLNVSIEGGDSFIRLRAPAGSEVIVFGYAGEPYLRFAPDGTIAENRFSAATYENENRFGASEVPPFVDYTAEPQWDDVGTGGVWAWHDHRSHWMLPDPPIGLDPGDSLPQQSIPIAVDGRSVNIVVETTLIAAPSWWPTAFGVLLGLQLALLGWWLGPATATLTTLLVSLAALVTGAGQFLSLPRETGPVHLWWLMPAVALVSGLTAIGLSGRSALLVRGLLALSGAQLFIWALMRRDVLTRPILPTDVAFWFDRATTGGALAAGGIVCALAVRSLLAPMATPTERQPEAH